MSKVISVDFKEKKIKEEPKLIKKHVKSNVSFVDFKSKKVLETIKEEETVFENVEDFDMKDFNTPPVNSYFHCFNNKERTDHSEHILSYLHDFDFSEILHFINMGVLDKRKLANKLNIPYLIEENAS